MRHKYSYTTFCSVIDDPQCANIIIYHKQTLASGDIITYNLYVVWLRMFVRKYQAYAEILIIEFSGNETWNACHVYSAVYSGADQRKHQSYASLAFVRGIHRWPENSTHKWPVTRNMFPFDAVIMLSLRFQWMRLGMHAILTFRYLYFYISDGVYVEIL